MKRPKQHGSMSISPLQLPYLYVYVCGTTSPFTSWQRSHNIQIRLRDFLELLAPLIGGNCAFISPDLSFTDQQHKQSRMQTVHIGPYLFAMVETHNTSDCHPKQDHIKDEHQAK